MKVQILSDLHLEVERPAAASGQEFYFFDIPVHAEHLALLGDIGWTIQDELFDWLRAQLKRFKTVFFVSGNHEPYRSTIAKSEARIRAFADEVNIESSGFGTFIYLNRTRHDVSPKLTILGCTLWSALNPAELDILSWSLTDFRRIEGFDPAAYNAQHRTDLEWLNATVQDIATNEPDRRIVVFTHHPPTIDGACDPKFVGELTNSAFATELTAEPCWTSGRVTLWAFGHTHWSCDFERRGVRVYSNQRGYREGKEPYSPTRVVEVAEE